MNKLELAIDEILGPIYTKESTCFRVWAPGKKKIELLIYEEYNQIRRQIYPMTKRVDGVFELTVNGDLDGKFYTYLIEDKYEVTDPYSKSSSINSEKSAIIDLRSTDPDGFRDYEKPINKYSEAIIYEVHVKDFTVDISSGVLNRGKYNGFRETGNRNGMITGINHLKELGITHVHLLPLADFITVREEPDKFFNSDNYNWGYDPELFNVPEGSYATNPYDPKNRIIELKKLIMALHKAGISVVIDVVYNHTYRTVDTNFNTLVPNYYYRHFNGSFSNGSGCGNEIASEKPMMQKFIIESLKYWQSEFRVDGFRFDLMALIDTDTIYKAIDELRAHDSETIIYGEPWTAQSSPLPLNKRTSFGSQRNRNFALFNPYFRDALKGDGDDINRGFIQGDTNYKNQIETGIIGSINKDASHSGFCSEPDETINYYNSHDNLILIDKMKIWFGNTPELKDMSMLANSILMTSQGIPFIHAGNEFLRDKKLVKNSYNSDLSVNAINWDYKSENIDVFYHTRDIINFRREHMEFFTLNSDNIRKNVSFIEDLPAHVIGYTIKVKNRMLLILHNAGWDNYKLDIKIIKSLIKTSHCNITEVFNNHGKTNKNIKMNEDYEVNRISTGILEIRYE